MNWRGLCSHTHTHTKILQIIKPKKDCVIYNGWLINTFWKMCEIGTWTVTNALTQWLRTACLSGAHCWSHSVSQISTRPRDTDTHPQGQRGGSTLTYHLNLVETLVGQHGATAEENPGASANTHTHMHKHTHTHTHKPKHTHTQAHAYAQTHAHTYTQTQTHTYTGTHTCTSTGAHTHTHTHTYIQAHTCAHTHTHKPSHLLALTVSVNGLSV